MIIKHKTWLLSAIIDKQEKKMYFDIELNCNKELNKIEKKELTERIESLIISIMSDEKMTILNLKKEKLDSIFEKKANRILEIDSAKITNTFLK